MSRDQEADDIQQLFDHNREWAAQMEQDDPGFFGRLAKQQEPDFLWIGCSDSRVPPTRSPGSCQAKCSFIAMSPILSCKPI